MVRDAPAAAVQNLRQVTFFLGPQQHQAVVERKVALIVLSDTAELGWRGTEGLEKLARVRARLVLVDI